MQQGKFLDFLHCSNAFLAVLTNQNDRKHKSFHAIFYQLSKLITSDLRDVFVDKKKKQAKTSNKGRTISRSRLFSNQRDVLVPIAALPS